MKDRTPPDPKEAAKAFAPHPSNSTPLYEELVAESRSALTTTVRQV